MLHGEEKTFNRNKIRSRRGYICLALEKDPEMRKIKPWTFAKAMSKKYAASFSPDPIPKAKVTF